MKQNRLELTVWSKNVKIFFGTIRPLLGYIWSSSICVDGSSISSLPTPVHLLLCSNQPALWQLASLSPDLLTIITGVMLPLMWCNWLHIQHRHPFPSHLSLDHLHCMPSLPVSWWSDVIDWWWCRSYTMCVIHMHHHCQALLMCRKGLTIWLRTKWCITIKLAGAGVTQEHHFHHHCHPLK